MNLIRHAGGLHRDGGYNEASQLAPFWRRSRKRRRLVAEWHQPRRLLVDAVPRDTATAALEQLAARTQARGTTGQARARQCSFAACARLRAGAPDFFVTLDSAGSMSSPDTGLVRASSQEIPG